MMSQLRLHTTMPSGSGIDQSLFAAGTKKFISANCQVALVCARWHQLNWSYYECKHLVMLIYIMIIMNYSLFCQILKYKSAMYQIQIQFQAQPLFWSIFF